MALQVVTIGGGTGHYTELRALKLIPELDLTAVVSMADSGGSSGRLRDRHGALPPGDVLQCLLALSELPGEVARNMLRHRFEGGPLEGDNAGNWLLTVLTQMTGSFLEAIRYAEQFLRVKGHVLPVTVGNLTLHGKSLKGKEVHGEASFDRLHDLLEPDDRITKVWLEPNALALAEASEAFCRADFVVLSSGDLFSSVIPVLLVRGVCEALARTKARLIYVCNLVTTRGQTDNFTVPDFVEALEQYLQRCVDVVLYHSQGLDEVRARRYADVDRAHAVEAGDLQRLAGRQLLSSNFLTEGDLVRHDERQLAIIFGILFGQLPRGVVPQRSSGAVVVSAGG